MSKIVIHNDTVYLCGQVADNADAPIGPQTENMLAKVDVTVDTLVAAAMTGALT